MFFDNAFCCNCGRIFGLGGSMRSDPVITTIFILGLIILNLIYGEIVFKIIVLSPVIFILLGFIIAPIIKVLEYFKAVKK